MQQISRRCPALLKLSVCAPPITPAHGQMVRVHSWEERDPVEPGVAQGPAEPPNQPREDAALEKAIAGRELAEVLLALHLEGALSAKHTCIISHWASKAGAVGPVNDFAFRPNAPSGHFQRHLDKVAGLRGNSGAFYELAVPGHTKHSDARAVNSVSVRLPHECLHQEHTLNPDLTEGFDASEWPSSYNDHTAVKDKPGPVVPLALYLDGAQYIKRDQVLVFVVCNLLSGARHLSCVLKKKDLCRCGCRGFCSLRPIMAMLAWSFKALASGTFPVCKHDGSPWGNDEERSSLGGLPLSLAAAVTQVRGDWAEFAHSLFFPSWKHSLFPCVWCTCDAESMYDWEGTSPTSVPWDPVRPQDYEAACARCERFVTVATEDQRNRILELLRYDKRPNGSRGRALKGAIPELGLASGDRLEPSAACEDVALFDTISLPCTVVFWRPSLDTVTRHRNPLFQPGTGVTVASLRVDPLHCLYLGVFQAHCCHVLWALIDADAWQTGMAHAVERAQESCIRIQAGLHQWCRQRRRSHPNEPLTEVQDITVQTIGTRDYQRLGLKGGETKTLMLFLQERLAQWHGTVEHGGRMLEAGGALISHIGVMKEANRKFTEDQQKDIWGKQTVSLVLSNCNLSAGANREPGRLDLCGPMLRFRLPCLRNSTARSSRPSTPWGTTSSGTPRSTSGSTWAGQLAKLRPGIANVCRCRCCVCSGCLVRGGIASPQDG